MPLWEWRHYTYVYDGAVQHLYRNGLLVDTNGCSSMAHSALALRIGARGSDGTAYPFHGFTDDIRIYYRALSAAEVRREANKALASLAQTKYRVICASDLHYANSPVSTSNLVGWVNTEAAGDGADALFVLGDIANTDATTTNDYPAVSNAFDALTVPYYLTTGNHDHSGTDTLWKTYFDELPRNISVGGYNWLMLGMDDNTIANADVLEAWEETWLTNQLEAADRAVILAHADMWDNDQYSASDPEYQIISSNYAAKIAASLHGHNHDKDGDRAVEAGALSVLWDGRVDGSWGTDAGYRVIEILENGGLYTYYQIGGGAKRERYFLGR